MTRLGQRDQVLLYGVSGSSKALLDASMIIWNIVGLAALGALAVWLTQRLRDRRTAGASSTLGERLFSGRTAPGSHLPEAPRAEQIGRARFVTGNVTNEDILAHELEAYQSQEPVEARAGQNPPTLPPTSEDILASQLEQSSKPRKKEGK